MASERAARTIVNPHGMHLVGSVPLRDSGAVYRCVCGIAAEHIKRLPDGETGARTHWIAWQLEVFRSMRELESEIVTTGYIKRAKFRLKAGADIGALRFPALGYAAAARASYAEFVRQRTAGVIPARVKFQVCLPTPLAPLHSYVFPESMAALEAPYEHALLSELNQIARDIPHADLAIQWDTAIEFAVLEGMMPTFYANPEADILERLVRWGNAVPVDIELGYHLCYGDSGHKHFKEPDDTSRLVAVSNHLALGLARPLDWIHLPVPRSRADDAYFAPLAGLRLREQTELYLGLVHLTDGVEGARRRIAAAARHVDRFGIGAECGFGRRAPETVADLLKIHVQVCAPVA